MNGQQASLISDDHETYRAVTEGREVPPESIGRLVALGLVAEHPYETGRWVAIDPKDAAQRLLDAQRAILRASAEAAATIGALAALQPAFDAQRMYSPDVSEFLPAMQQVNDRLGQVSAQAREEIYAAQPAVPEARSPEARSIGTRRSLALVRRGVQHRVLYSVGAVRDSLTADYVREFTDAGGEVRVLDRPFPRMVLIDRRHLFIDDHVREGKRPHSGWHVRDRASVMWARSEYERYWQAAAPWSQAAIRPDDVSLTDRQALILDRMAAGLDAPAVARAARLSPRMLTNELAAIRAKLGVETTNQALVWYGRRTAQRERL
ncbi:hypothetical protein ACGFXC_09380 [Streptomyces sp. NPDC048507]|uniref:hypothetical protein n=1 Tax=Streptomyces sp. NPDC048507 TaxID=3365560 RepID=UPI0037128989